MLFFQVRAIVREEISAGNVLQAVELSAVEDALKDKLDAVIKEVDERASKLSDAEAKLAPILSDAEAGLAPILAAVARVDRLARRLGIMPLACRIQEQLGKLRDHVATQLKSLLPKLDQQMEDAAETLAKLEVSAARLAAQLWPVHDLLAAAKPSLPAVKDAPKEVPAVKDVRVAAAWVSARERELKELREMVRPRSA